MVVDDTSYSGRAMNDVRNELKKIEGFEYIYICVFLEGEKAREGVDIYLEDVIKYTKDSEIPIILYEWNFTQHYPFIMERCLYDIDGVLCKEPPDERNTNEYEEYIKNAIPLFVPKVKIGGIVTYRLNKYRNITNDWFKKYGVDYNNMFMFNAESWEERNNSGVTPEQYKSLIYKSLPYMILFVESNDYQAKQIWELTNKPVLSIEKNYLYGGK